MHLIAKEGGEGLPGETFQNTETILFIIVLCFNNLVISSPEKSKAIRTRIDL
jgi:hypothetical protein